MAGVLLRPEGPKSDGGAGAVSCGAGLRQYRGPRRCRGVSLFEAMVAIFVLSIGLIGLASLQINGMRFNQDAFVRSQATVMVYDVIEQLRIDRTVAIDDGSYSGTYGAAEADGVCAPAVTSSASAIACWRVRLRDRIPGGSLTVAGPTGADNNQFTVTLTWTDSWRAKGASTGSQSQQSLVVRI